MASRDEEEMTPSQTTSLVLEKTQEGPHGKGVMDNQKIQRSSKYADTDAMVADQVLHLAKVYSYETMVPLLERNPHIDMSATDNTGKTLLHYVASSQRTDVLRLVLERKIPINHADREGKTALHYAAARGHREAIKELINHGAFVDYTDYARGRTPLHYAVEKKHSETAMFLMKRGADAAVIDNEGRSIVDLCEDQKLKQVFSKAVSEAKEIKLGQIEVETITVTNASVERFRRHGITVLCSQLGEDGAFDLTCRKESKEHAKVNLPVEEGDELCSDVYTFTVGNNLPKEIISLPCTLMLPLFYGPKTTEELVMKTDSLQEMKITNIEKHRIVWAGTTTVDFKSFQSLVVVCRRKTDKFKIGPKAIKIQPSVDKRLELNFKDNTFKTTINFSISVTEPPSMEADDNSAYGNILSTTSFYSVDAEGSKPQKSVAVKAPLPDEFTGRGQIVVLSMSEEEENETEDSWTVLNKNAKVEQGKIAFSLSSFSYKVAVEIPKEVFFDEVSLKKHVHHLHQKARWKEYDVAFLCLQKRQENSDSSFRLLIECCLIDQQNDRKQNWSSEGFEVQSMPNSTFRIEARQKFKISLSKSVGLFGEEMNQLLEFHPRRGKNYQFFGLRISEGGRSVTGIVEIVKLARRTRWQEASLEEENGEILTTIKFDFYRTTQRDNPNSGNPGAHDVPVFFDEKLLTEITDNLREEDWYKVYILLGFSFKEVENRLKGPAPLSSKLKELTVIWRDSCIGEDHQGLPLMLSALFKGGYRNLAGIVQIRLKAWFGSQKSSRPSHLYSWVSKAYNDSNLMVPGDYVRPMSDAFLVLLAGGLGPSHSLATRLNIPDVEFREIMNSPFYTTDCLKATKLLAAFRDGSSDPVEALEELIKVLDALDLTDQRDYTLKSTKAWLKQNTHLKSPFREEVAKIVNKA